MDPSSHPFIFDRMSVRRHRDRAAAHFAAHDALFQDTSALLTERLLDVNRKFVSILDLGGHQGDLAGRLRAHYNAFVATTDLSERMLQCIKMENAIDVASAVVADEELLPFAEKSFDLAVSNLSLHWCNDIPGVFAQIKAALRPEALFMASLIGGNSLFELRSCLLDAELALTGGVSPRVSPSIDLSTASALLQRAGFALPVTDFETVTLVYRDAFALMRDLRAMGETNAHVQRLKGATQKNVLVEAARLYQSRFADRNGSVAATIEVLFLHGWNL